MFTLAGCSAGNNTEHSSEESKPQMNESTVKAETKVKEDVYVPNPQVTDDLNLVKVGETISDSKGKLTLKSYKQVNQTIKVGPVEMMIKDVKVLHFIPSYNMIDFFHAYTHEEEFDFIKIGVEIKNTSNEQVKYTPIAALKVNNEEHKTWEDDIYLEELAGVVEPGDVKKGNMGFILDHTKEVEWIELLTSDVVDENQKIVEQGKNTKIELQ